MVLEAPMDPHGARDHLPSGTDAPEGHPLFARRRGRTAFGGHRGVADRAASRLRLGCRRGSGPASLLLSQPVALRFYVGPAALLELRLALVDRPPLELGVPAGAEHSTQDPSEEHRYQRHDADHRAEVHEVLALDRKLALVEWKVEVGVGAHRIHDGGDDGPDDQRDDRNQQAVEKTRASPHAAGGVPAPQVSDKDRNNECHAGCEADVLGGVASDVGYVDPGGGKDAADERRQEKHRSERHDDAGEDGSDRDPSSSEHGPFALFRHRAVFLAELHAAPSGSGEIGFLLQFPQRSSLNRARLVIASRGLETLIRYVVVVDGEHYPPVVEAALTGLVNDGHAVVAATLAGGREKLPAKGVEAYGDFEVRSGDDPLAVFDRALTELEPDAVRDLSDEPVLDYRRRHEMASIALFRGIRYEGADFHFTPPPRPDVCAHPSLAIIATGKRTGKTAVAGFTARHLSESGRKPVVVAMGRGGPPEPDVLRGDELSMDPKDLLALADSGKHAASDYIEDAMLARVPTVGCRRCGGGLAGGVDVSNVHRGVELANDLDGNLIVLEGSGSAVPPVRADVTGLVVPASIQQEYLVGYMGPYRLLLADFALVTMCEPPFGSSEQISAVISRIRDAWRPDTGGGEREELKVVRTVFRPAPTRSVEGAEVFVATTAPEAAGESIRKHLEHEHGARVVGVSHSLSNREALEEELDSVADGPDVVLCEIKAAGIDVATRWALDRGTDVVYMDNVPLGVEGDDPEDVVEWAAELAQERFQHRR
jgi:cyclic 2,3-diphosphoglycerate synthase